MKTGENYNTLYTVDDKGKPYSGASLNEVVIKGSDWSHTLYKATENFFGVTEAELHDPESDAVSKMMKKEASIIASISLNILSFGEGYAALKGASAIGKGIGIYGMANDPNDLLNDLTGFNAAEAVLGEKGSEFNTMVNSILGLRQMANENKFSIGNISDIKDLISNKSLENNGRKK